MWRHWRKIALSGAVPAGIQGSQGHGGPPYQRSRIIDEVNALRDNSVDYYAAVRSSYYQNRNAAIKNTDSSVLNPLPIISIEFE